MDLLTKDTSGETVLAKLKAGTSHLHDRLENQLDLLRPNFQMSDYVDLLGKLYGYYRPWEQQAWRVLYSFSPALLAGRRKAELLADDLRYFHVQPEGLSTCVQLPPLGDISQALGSLYVLEGSTLGGQILCRHWHRTLGLEVNGISFFHGYGEKTGLMWREFCAILNKFSTDGEEPQIIASAQATFETLNVWMAKPRPL